MYRDTTNAEPEMCGYTIIIIIIITIIIIIIVIIITHIPPFTAVQSDLQAVQSH